MLAKTSVALEFDRTKRVDQPESVAAPVSTRPTWYWTWRLYSMGMTTSEVVQIRGLGAEELALHVRIASEQGLEIDSDWLAGLK